MKKSLVLPLIALCVLAGAVSAASAAQHRFHKNYTGHAGCPSYVPPYSTGVCAYHTGVSKVVAYTSVKHWVSFAGVVGQCSPGPCTATANLGHDANGTVTIGNTSQYGMYVYSVTESG